MGASLSAEASAIDARAAIEAAAPAIELVDYAKPRGSLEDVIEGCMFHSASVIGPFAPLQASSTSLAITAGVLSGK